MVEHLTLGIMVDIVPTLLCPDTLCQEHVILLLEAAGNDHAGLGQGGEPERNPTSQGVEHWEETIRTPKGKL